MELAKKNKVFGTKMRSLINGANNIGIKDLVDQQFDIGEEILSFGLLPIIEPEVDITIPDKREAEDMLYNNIKRRLNRIESSKKVILKLSLPEQDNFYEPLMQHPNILRIVALSGGFEKKIAVNKLKQNKKMKYLGQHQRFMLKKVQVMQDTQVERLQYLLVVVLPMDQKVN